MGLEKYGSNDRFLAEGLHLYRDLMGQIQLLKERVKPDGKEIQEWVTKADELLSRMEALFPKFELEFSIPIEYRPVADILNAIKLIESFPNYNEILSQDIIQRIRDYRSTIN